jgi:hypothetical protein
MAKLTKEELLKIILFDEKFINRFWSNVDKSGGEDACWNWLKSPYNEEKYGQFRVGGQRGVVYGTHCISLTMKLGRFPKQDTCHSCKVKNNKCVNPKHLRDDSEKENRRDINKDGRTLKQQNNRKEEFQKLMEESSKTEKKFFYDVLYNEIYKTNR